MDKWVDVGVRWEYKWDLTYPRWTGFANGQSARRDAAWDVPRPVRAASVGAPDADIGRPQPSPDEVPNVEVPPIELIQ